MLLNPPAPLAIPTLETERLRLRGHIRADFAASCALWADPLVTRYIGGKPQSAEEIWSRLLRYLGHWALLGFGYWVVEEKATGDFAGEIGLSDYRRQIEPPLGDVPEIGWVIASAKQGKGYAQEAIAAVFQWARGQAFPSNEIACLVHPENLTSLHLARKLGFEERYTATYKGTPTIVMFWHRGYPR